MKVTYVKGEYAGLNIESKFEQRADGLYARPLKSFYRFATGLDTNCLGFVPIGDRTDWTKFGFISEEKE